jgi:hypothetical protein
MTTAYEKARALYSSDEQMARVQFAMLMIQEAKLEPADQARKQKTGEQMDQMNEISRAEGGAAVKTWRERLGFGADFPLHSASIVERAMEAEIAELRAARSQVTPASPIGRSLIGKLPVVAAALSHLSSERIAAAVLEVPCTYPQQYVAIGTATEIGQLLPEAIPATGRAAAEIGALLLEMTTFDAKLVDGSRLAQRAATILAIQQEGGAA